MLTLMEIERGIHMNDEDHKAVGDLLKELEVKKDLIQLHAALDIMLLLWYGALSEAEIIAFYQHTYDKASEGVIRYVIELLIEAKVIIKQQGQKEGYTLNHAKAMKLRDRLFS